MNYDIVEKMMIKDEGIRYQLYEDSKMNTTIGIGYNIERNGISKKIALDIFKECYGEIIRDLDKIFIDQSFLTFPENIQMVLFNMRFQMGYRGFRLFKKMIKAIKKQDWQEMIVEMKDSRWYNKYRLRANRLVDMVQEVINGQR